MDMKIEVNVDLGDFIEKWGDDTLEEFIKDEIKSDVLRAVKASRRYKRIVAERQAEMLRMLDE